jgi:hypothetical protein
LLSLTYLSEKAYPLVCIKIQSYLENPIPIGKMQVAVKWKNSEGIRLLEQVHKILKELNPPA